MIERLHAASTGLSILIREFPNNSRVDFSCGIIVRAIFLDYLIMLNAIVILAKNENDLISCEEEIKKYCLLMLSDSVNHTLKHFKSLEGNIPQNIMSNMYINLVNANPTCFEDYTGDGSQPVPKATGYKKPHDLYLTLLKEPGFEKYVSAYDVYTYYSKYDHFGGMNYSLSRMSNMKQFVFLNKAIKSFPTHLLFTTAILRTHFKSDTFLEATQSRIEDFISTIK
ncbi:hypothetical protein [Filimonas effusa]|uniref:Uncharacterized protein n=1 Tax=Filimonas effusa TaxID=2508721 RepID=A0A4Q1DBN5_9BACT|nr:hypothetical protein [Filimonas effusa]RXK86871.1 hypothetical protein ESB13_08790 [Filimonas effusa]